jgi:hypothetical protein
VCSLVTLSKYYSTKNKTLLAGSIGQRLLCIFTALSPFYVEQPHDKGSALYKYTTKSCKNNFERSTGPKVIEATTETLFTFTQDYSIRLNWDPFPESYSFMNGDKVERGLHLNVVDKAGRSMVVEYVSYKPPLVASIRMISGPWYIKRFAGSWSFKKLDGNRTRVIFKYNIVSYPAFIGPLVCYIFRQNTNKRLSSLKAYVESKR